ncbi:MAG: hypothetical protein IKF16_00425 [Lachnospiraceae bacterium]|nr:hypothetical protein [Lachnospiraceae bacterium]
MAAKKRKKAVEQIKGMVPIRQYELALFYEDMADKLQVEEYRSRYYARARDIIKLLIEMVKYGDTASGEYAEETEETETSDPDQAEEDMSDYFGMPESFSDDEDGADLDDDEDTGSEDPDYIAEVLSLKNLRAVRDRIRRKTYDSRARTIIEAYDSAAALRDSAAAAAELRYAAEQFGDMERLVRRKRLLEKYMDPVLFKQASACSDFMEQAEKLRKRAMKMERRIRLRIFLISAVAIIVLLIAFGFTKTSTYLKLKGDFEMAIGMEEKAWQAYGSALKKHGREDLRETYDAARRAAGIKAFREENWNAARDTLREIAQSDDTEADEMYAEAERNAIGGTAPGKTVHFAGTDWTVLENDGTSALLLRLENIPETAFSADGKPCTWADSSLREYLNGRYIKEKFTPAETALLMESELDEEPSETGSAVNPATADTVYIFSIGEFEKYKNSFPEWTKDTWLRTPGEYEGMEAFAGIGNTVMPNGYDVGTDAIRVKPVIKINLS